MRAIAVGILSACLVFAPALACVEPELGIAVPDGATATREEMLSAQKAMRAYDAAVKEYVTCLEPAGVVGESKGNSAVSKLTRLANQFNAELRAFKKKNGA